MSSQDTLSPQALQHTASILGFSASDPTGGHYHSYASDPASLPKRSLSLNVHNLYWFCSPQDANWYNWDNSWDREGYGVRWGGVGGNVTQVTSACFSCVTGWDRAMERERATYLTRGRGWSEKVWYLGWRIHSNSMDERLLDCVHRRKRMSKDSEMRETQMTCLFWGTAALAYVKERERKGTRRKWVVRNSRIIGSQHYDWGTLLNLGMSSRFALMWTLTGRWPHREREKEKEGERS